MLISKLFTALLMISSFVADETDKKRSKSGIDWVEDFDSALEQAKESWKPMMLYFGAAG